MEEEGGRTNPSMHEGRKPLRRAIIPLKDLMEHVIACEMEEGVAGVGR